MDEDFLREFFHLPKKGGNPLPNPSVGCICPPTSEQTCMNPSCPRKPMDMRPTCGPAP